jgi:hypothetical protein
VRKQLGQYHTTLSASSRQALQASVLAWQKERQRELAALIARPEGEPTRVHDCSARSHHETRSVLPPWVPNRPCPPERYEFEFSLDTRRTGTTHLGFVTLSVFDTDAPE